MPIPPKELLDLNATCNVFRVQELPVRGVDDVLRAASVIIESMLNIGEHECQNYMVRVIYFQDRSAAGKEEDNGEG